MFWLDKAKGGHSHVPILLRLSRLFKYAPSLPIFNCNYTRRVYIRAGPWTFGFGILLSLHSPCLLVTLGRLRPEKKKKNHDTRFTSSRIANAVNLLVPY